MLTLQQLKDMPVGYIFAKGMALDAEGVVNVANTGSMIKWIAVRGTIHDWAIYTDNPHQPLADFEQLRTMGEKLKNLKYVQMCVPCEKEALEMYRL